MGHKYHDFYNEFIFKDYIQTTIEKIKGKHKIFETTFSFGEQQFSLLGISTGSQENSKLIFLLKDITKKQLENIEYINKSKLESMQELAAGTANDIKNPLTVANGFLQLLKLQLTQPKEQYYVEQALKAISDTDDYIEIFALWGNPSKDHHKFRDFNLTKLVEKINLEFKERYQGNNIKLSIDLQKDIIVYGKEKLINKAISSIMENAYESIKGNGQILTILKKTGNTVILEVEDNGIFYN